MSGLYLRSSTVQDIESRVERVLRGLGNPEPPLDLSLVRELLKLDREFYTGASDGRFQEVVSRIRVAGRQVIMRPAILMDAIRKLDLRALYLPDRKRILLDESIPVLKHRWNEAHEVGHSLLPWHSDTMFGDTSHSLTPSCHAQIEAEANYTAGQLLFLGPRFREEVAASDPSIEVIQQFSKGYGNTLTSTLWRYVESLPREVPAAAIISSHPHLAKRPETVEPLGPCKYFIRSFAFATRFSGTSALELFAAAQGYCTAKSGGSLGEGTIMLVEDNGQRHEFRLETFFNRYEALTLAVHEKALGSVIQVI